MVEQKYGRFVIGYPYESFLYRDAKLGDYSFTSDISKASVYRTINKAYSIITTKLDSSYWYYGEEDDKTVSIMEIDENNKIIRVVEG